MPLFPAELDITPDEGFTPEKDIFGRKSFGERLTRIVGTIDTPCVLLLDAAWGTGKSTFIKMWRGDLKKNGISSISFDAFANDYQKDAFLAITSQILAEVKRLKPSKTADFKEKALNVVKILGKASIKVGIRAASMGVIDAEHLENAGAEIVKAAGEESANAIDKLLEERLESHDLDREAFESFKAALEEVAKALTAPATAEGSQRQKPLPLVFIIDELDRCRPLFALELLEKIKHFFAVPNVIFVLSSSLSQLESAVKFAYGDIDARTYLEKFYHIRILFPSGRPGRPNMTEETYLHHLSCNPQIAKIICACAQVRPLSLRTIERIVAYAKIVEVSLPRNSVFIPELIGVLCILKVIAPNLYAAVRQGEEFVNEKHVFLQICSLLPFGKCRDPYDSTAQLANAVHAEHWLRFCLNQSPDEEATQQMKRVLSQYQIGTRNIIPYFCDFIDCFSFSGEE